MPSLAPIYPVPGSVRRACRRGPLPAPAFDPTDYWATRKWAKSYVALVFEETGRRIDELTRRVDEIVEKGIPDDKFNEIARRNKVAYLKDVPSLADREFSLSDNDDLYIALSAIIPAMGGKVTL